MELVVKISEEIYKNIQSKSTEIQAEGCAIENAILNGIPLPKGHGRLIDGDELNNSLREQQRSYEHTFGIRQPINEAVRDGIIMARCHIDHASTIIEADKEQE